MNYIFIGMRGVGKTTIAYKLSSYISSHTYYDTDDIFEEQYKIPVYSYILNHGIHSFRKYESKILHSLILHTNAIISTGGGIVSYEQNRNLLIQEKKKGTKIVFLHAPLDTLYKRRVEQSPQKPRPLLYDTTNISEEISVSWKKRKQWYYMLATHIIYTEGKTINDIVKASLAL